MPVINLHDQFILDTTEEPVIIYDKIYNDELIEISTQLTSYILITHLIINELITRLKIIFSNKKLKSGNIAEKIIYLRKKKI